MEKIKKLLQQALNEEWLAFILYAAQAAYVRGYHKDGMSDHFSEHASEEKDHMERLVAHMQAKGMDPKYNSPEIIIDRDLDGMVNRDLNEEINAINTYRLLSEACEGYEDFVDTKMLAEDILLEEVEHQDDFAGLLEKTIKKSFNLSKFIGGM